MESSDFDFPPSPTDDGKLDVDISNADEIPMRTLWRTAPEELPQTKLPENQMRPIRHAIRANQKLAQRGKTGPRVSSVGSDCDGGNDPKEEEVQIKAEGQGQVARSFSGGQKRPRYNWTEEELSDFYKFLSQYGTDFNAITVLYADRTREDIKRLYHRELRRRQWKVRRALSMHESIDLATFNSCLRKREEQKRKSQTRKLEKEEEEVLRLLEAGTLCTHPTPEETTNSVKEGDGEFSFSFNVKEEQEAQMVEHPNEVERETVSGINQCTPVTEVDDQAPSEPNVEDEFTITC
uniref:Myb-like domain-containing protein n=1 Tax=Trypanosoma congolense (strain IL3000) TaxID=1068625 RepID=G0UWY1_TRYCI|nr:conserved hypothetical protein [Trypanosoma congolense IL3000]